MSQPKHSPPGDGSFRRSLLRNGGSALGLVVLVAVTFWGIGSVGDDRTPAVADGSAGEGPATEAPAEPDGAGDAATDEPPAERPSTGADGTETADDGAPEEPTEGQPTEREPADEVDPASEEPDATEELTAPDEPDEPDEAPAVAPADVTIQVLDGVKDDGGTAADGVAAELSGAGYQIIARNDALSYDVTTVLYNVGNEVAAQQVADELGAAEVREQPGNLSTQVDLHVVVGRDRA